MTRWIQRHKESVAAADGHNPTTEERQDIVDSHQNPFHGHTCQQTDGQILTTRDQPRPWIPYVHDSDMADISIWSIGGPESGNLWLANVAGQLRFIIVYWTISLLYTEQ